MNRVTDTNEQRSATASTYTKREKSTKIDYSFAAFIFNGFFSERSKNTKESIKNIYTVL